MQLVLLQGVALLQDLYRDTRLRPTTEINLWVVQPDCRPGG
jgi:hypothetical protein